MNVVIFSKPAFSGAVGSCSGSASTAVPIALAGHTIQLVRPLVEYLSESGSTISMIVPRTLPRGDPQIVDYGDQLPPRVQVFQVGSNEPPKSTYRTDGLELLSALQLSEQHTGTPDWIVIVNAFPTLVYVRQACALLREWNAEFRPRIAVLLRGGDGYKWTNTTYTAQHITEASVAESVTSAYIRCLREADYVGVASRWLRDVVVSRGIEGASVLPSPPVSPNGHISMVNKIALRRAELHRFGCLNPERSWLGVVGRIHPDKRPDLALEAFGKSNLDAWQLIYAGDGNIEGLQERIRRLPAAAQERIACVSVPPAKLPTLYGALDAIVHTSLPGPEFTDARPSALTSASFHSKPVVAVLGGGVAECLSLRCAAELCVDPRECDSRDALSDALAIRLNYLNNGAFRAEIGRLNYVHTLESGAVDSVKRFVDDIISLPVDYTISGDRK